MLDSIRKDEFPNFKTVFQFETNGLTAASASEPLASSRLGLWKTLRNIPRSTHLVAQRHAGVTFASSYGGTIIDAQGMINVGLLLPQLQNRDHVEIAPEQLPAMMFADRAEQIIVNIAKRLARIETPRVMRIEAGKESHILHAQKTGFGILNKPDGLTDLLSAIRTAASKKEPVRYTLDPRPDEFVDTQYTWRHLIMPVQSSDAKDNSLCFADTGWPTHCPKGTSFNTVTILSSVIKAISAWNSDGGAATVQVLDAERGRLMIARRLDDAIWHVTLAPKLDLSG